jgi:hypothetical protein
MLPGINAGWSEASIAGALQRNLIGPIWRDGHRVTDLWIGEIGDPEGGSAEDYRRAVRIVAVAAALFVLLWVCLMVTLPPTKSSGGTASLPHSVGSGETGPGARLASESSPQTFRTVSP